MDGYLGEVDVTDAAPFATYGPAEWAVFFIEKYGQIDGDWHKAWVLDTVSRILHGTPVSVKLARWSNGETEYRATLGEPSAAYLAWRGAMEADGYDEGIGP